MWSNGADKVEGESQVLGFWLMFSSASAEPVRGFNPAVGGFEGCLSIQEVEGWLGWGIYGDAAA